MGVLAGLFGVRKKPRFNAHITITEKGFEQLMKNNTPLEKQILEKVADCSATVGNVVREIQQNDPRISMRGIIQTIEQMKRRGFVEIMDLGDDR